MNKDAKLICERIEPLFKQLSKTRYSLMVSNNIYGKKLNFFFQSQRAYHRLKSTPLHTLEKYDLEYLEQVVDEIRSQYKFSIEYVGFTNEVWPKKQTVIQKKKNHLE